MGHGGKRAGAGKPKGQVSAHRRAKLASTKLFEQRIMKELQPLIRSQFNLAHGVMVMFAKGAGKDAKFAKVTSQPQIEQLINGKGENGEDYYYLSTQEPDGRMLDSLMNRICGKPVDMFPEPENDEKGIPAGVRYIIVERAS